MCRSGTLGAIVLSGTLVAACGGDEFVTSSEQDASLDRFDSNNESGGSAGSAGQGGATEDSGQGGAGGTAAQAGSGGAGGTVAQGGSGGTVAQGGSGGVAGGGASGSAGVGVCASGAACNTELDPALWTLAGDFFGAGSCKKDLVYPKKLVDVLQTNSLCKYLCSTPNQAKCSTQVTCSNSDNCLGGGTVTIEQEQCAAISAVAFCSASPPMTGSDCVADTGEVQPLLPTSVPLCLTSALACGATGLCLEDAHRCVGTENPAVVCPAPFTKMSEFYRTVSDERTCPPGACGETTCVPIGGAAGLEYFSLGSCQDGLVGIVPLSGTCVQVSKIVAVELRFKPDCAQSEVTHPISKGVTASGYLKVCCRED